MQEVEAVNYTKDYDFTELLNLSVDVECASYQSFVIACTECFNGIGERGQNIDVTTLIKYPRDSGEP